MGDIKQPANVNLSHGGTVVGKLDWSPSFASNLNANLDAAQEFIDTSVLRYCDKYVPMRSGKLKQSGILGTKIGSGSVVYNAPYSRYLYYGKVMVGRAPKTLTEKDLTFAGAPTRGAFWFERMKADYKDTILNGAAKIAGGSR